MADRVGSLTKDQNGFSAFIANHAHPKLGAHLKSEAQLKSALQKEQKVYEESRHEYDKLNRLEDAALKSVNPSLVTKLEDNIQELAGAAQPIASNTNAKVVADKAQEVV